MTFLEICNQVIRIMGIQGTLTDVENPKGIHRNIVEAVRSSWIDIQNLREDWTFMQYTTNLLNTVEDQIIYTPTEVFGTATAAEYLGTYQRKRGVFLTENGKNSMLAYVPWENYPFMDNTSATKPTWFTVNPANNNIYFQKPNGVYNITIRYIRSPQDLAINTDVPFIPTRYHQVISYKAVERASAYIGQTGLYQQYSLEANRILGEMMREFIRVRHMYPRSFV